MVEEDPPRSLAARAAAELALVRIATYYGGRPEFVLLGGLVPALLCSQSGIRHAGTTDVDVQVDLEISAGSVNAKRLEKALRDAGFHPDEQLIWRWKSENGPRGATVKFELLADLVRHRLRSAEQRPWRPSRRRSQDTTDIRQRNRISAVLPTGSRC